MSERDPEAAHRLGDISAWQKLSETEMARCAVFGLYSCRFRHPIRKAEGDFYVIQSNDWVNVLPVTPDKQVVLVKQFRFGIESMSWEIPGGIMDTGEDCVAAGLRELREETGYVSTSARVLGTVSPNPAILNNRCHFVLAEGVHLSGEQQWDEHEEIEVRLFPLDEVYAMAMRGEIVHALVLNALLYYYPEWMAVKARRRSTD